MVDLGLDKLGFVDNESIDVLPIEAFDLLLRIGVIRSLLFILSLILVLVRTLFTDLRLLSIIASAHFFYLCGFLNTGP